MEWIFTFGQEHYDSVTGEPLKDRFVRITANNKFAARQQMIQRYGMRWAFQYNSEEEAGVAEFDLRELE